MSKSKEARIQGLENELQRVESRLEALKKEKEGLERKLTVANDFVYKGTVIEIDGDPFMLAQVGSGVMCLISEVGNWYDQPFNSGDGAGCTLEQLGEHLEDSTDYWCVTDRKAHF